MEGRKAELLDTMLDTVSIVPPEPPALLDPRTLFDPPPTAIWMEIGFGGGEHLAAQAELHPDIGFIGCEPFMNGVSNLLSLLDQGGQKNVRILKDDARLLLQALPEGSIDGAFVLFPDPWPKRRHEDRRFLAAQGLAMLARVLTDGGALRVATDHAALGLWIEAGISGHPAFRRVLRSRTRPENWPPTRYEGKALAVGRQPVYLAYERVKRALQA